MNSANLTSSASAVTRPSLIAPVENLMDTLHRTGHFKHLMAVIRATGLASAFNSAGPHTVFAPNDQAFAKLDDGVLEELLQPRNKERLTAILRLHMVPRRVGAVVSGEDQATFKSLQGDNLAVYMAHGMRVNKARIVESDINASNGVIHVIDTVLMPDAG